MSLVISTRIPAKFPCNHRHAGAQKYRVENRKERHAREDAGVGFEIGCRRHIGFVPVGTLDRAGRIGDRETDDFRAEAAIGPRLGDEHLVAAARMPRRMNDRHNSPRERRGGRHA